MSKSKLAFTLHPNWEAVPNADVATFVRKRRMNTNVLQVSCISWQSSKDVAIDPNQIMDQWIAGMGATQITPVISPQPERMASSRFTRDEFPYCQAWSILERDNLINATFICDALPSPEELKEVQAMVDSLGVREQPKKKWLWF